MNGDLFNIALRQCEIGPYLLLSLDVAEDTQKLYSESIGHLHSYNGYLLLLKPQSKFKPVKLSLWHHQGVF